MSRSCNYIYRDNETMLSAWIDGDLEPDQAKELGSHLEQCESCRAAVADLEALRNAAADLADEPVAGDGWQQVRNQLPALSAGRRRLPRWTALAAAALVLVIVGVMVAGQLGQDPASPAESLARVELDRLQRQQQRTIAALQAVVEQRRGDWDAGLEQTFSSNLALVDRAIEECRRALKQQPTDLALRTSLMAAFQRKVDFLELFSSKEDPQ